MLRFHCPNGHPLSAPPHLAGKHGKCPKCGEPFLVPHSDEPSELPPPALMTGPAEAPAAGGSSPVTPAMGSGPNQGAAQGEIFVFLCPNGHKLNGPPSMKGKAGQCPHCGARFRIPTDEDLEEEEVPVGEAEGGETGIDFNRLLGAGAEPGEEEIDEGALDVLVASPPAGPSGLGYIVGRLWEQRTEMAQLEVFLVEGEILAPDYFSEVLSSSDYGVFAIQEGDGSFAVTIVPWSSVRRVAMRQLGDLSPELFS